MERICVYCASSTMVDEAYVRDARELGRLLAEAKMQLVYGAGVFGLMGAVCDGVKSAGGRVTGVIPRFMIERGWGRNDLDETMIVETMQERKQRMRDLGDAAVILPGGVGTFDEFMDSLSLKKLGMYDKPLILLNTLGFFSPLIEMMNRCVRDRFMLPEHKKMFTVASTPQDTIRQLRLPVAWDVPVIDNRAN